MQRMAIILIAFPAAAALAWSGDARALGPVSVEAAAKIGGGMNPTTTGPTPLGFGIGGRAGVSYAGFYLGGSAVAYLGGSATAGIEIESEHSAAYGVEGGYGLEILGHLTIRGLFGIGTFQQSGSGVATGGLGNLYLEPGVTAFWSFGWLIAGADVNAFLLPSAVGTTYAALTLHAQVGIVF
jgi:hypothetical protein